MKKVNILQLIASIFFVDWQYYKSVEFIDRDSICTLCLYRSTTLNIGDFVHYRFCQTDKKQEAK